MDIRGILLETDRAADYSGNELLREQAAQIDMHELTRIVLRLTTRATIIAHAHEMFENGAMKHPMQAFLHATECIRNPDGSRINDVEFYSLLRTWGQICERADYSNVSNPAQPAGSFYERFMGRSE